MKSKWKDRLPGACLLLLTSTRGSHEGCPDQEAPFLKPWLLTHSNLQQPNTLHNLQPRCSWDLLGLFFFFFLLHSSKTRANKTCRSVTASEWRNARVEGLNRRLGEQGSPVTTAGTCRSHPQPGQKCLKWEVCWKYRIKDTFLHKYTATETKSYRQNF